MPTILPQRIAPQPAQPVGALAYVAVALAFLVLVCSTIMTPPVPLDAGQSGGAGPAIHGT